MCNDQIIITNALNTQKHLTSLYNTAAGECCHNPLRSAMMELLRDEHEIQNDIFTGMSSRGWYPVQQATNQAVNQAIQELNAPFYEADIVET